MIVMRRLDKRLAALVLGKIAVGVFQMPGAVSFALTVMLAQAADMTRVNEI